jgi:hypothetical protein
MITYNNVMLKSKKVSIIKSRGRIFYKLIFNKLNRKCTSLKYYVILWQVNFFFK